MVTTKLMTAEELEAMPEDPFRYDLIRGELRRMSPTGFAHLRVAGNAIGHLHPCVAPRSLGVVGGEGGFVLALDPDTVLAPDIAFVRTERLPTDEQGFARLAPDIAGEVVSPSDTAAEIEEKVQEYLATGVPLVWVLRPNQRTVRVRKPDGTDRLLTEADDLDGGDVLLEFGIWVGKLFEEPRWVRSESCWAKWIGSAALPQGIAARV